MKGVKLLYCAKSLIDVFFLYTEVVNVLSSFITRRSKNGKNLLVSFSIVNLILGCLEFKYIKNFFSIDLIFKHEKVSST